MDQLYQHDKFLQIIEQVKLTTYHYWIGLYGPLFWFMSAILMRWDLDNKSAEKEFDFMDSVEFTPLTIHNDPIPPWQPISKPEQPSSIYIASSNQAKVINNNNDSKKLSTKCSFKSLKDQFSSWKKKNPDDPLKKRQHSTSSLPSKEKRMPFLRRFSSSSGDSNISSDDATAVKKKYFYKTISKPQSIRKLKSFF
jgi:hypothetical protein